MKNVSFQHFVFAAGYLLLYTIAYWNWPKSEFKFPYVDTK